jgi:hypothetical protein
VEDGIATDVEVLVVSGLGALIAERAGGIVFQGPETWLVDVAWGTFEAGRNDFAVV